MHGTRHDPNQAALHAGAKLPGYVLDVVVLTADSGLLATLRDASGPEHAIWHASSADAAVDLLVGGRCSILVCDLGALRGDAAALLERLHTQFPELVLMATGRRDEESSVAALIGDGRVYRFLHKPVSPARAHLFITAATRRYNELRNLEPIAPSTVKTLGTRPRVAWIVIAAIALLAIVAAAAIWWMSERATLLHQPVLAAPTRAAQIADLLAAAQMAYATDRLLEPRGNNALDYFREVLALQPDHPDALAGIERIAATLEERVVAALEARNAPEGAAAFSALRRAQPDHPRLDALYAELLKLSRSTRALPSSTAPPRPARPPARTPRSVESRPTAPDTSQRPAPEAAADASRRSSASAEELASVMRLRERGALIEPAGRNAYDQLMALRERYPPSDAIAGEQQRVAFALLERTRNALAAGDLDVASTFASRAEALLPGMSATKNLQSQIAAAQQQRELMKNVVPATSLQRTREVSPSYPRDAQREEVEGWVDVEFTIAPDGATQDLLVRAAQPGNTFDKAALDAVRRWRFAPVMRDGVAVPQRAGMRIRFELE